ILEATSLIALSSTSDPLVITSGTFKLSSTSTIAPFTTNTGAVIPATGGLWNNGGTINTDNSCSWTNYGMIKNSSGAIIIGVNSGNSFKYYSGSSFIMDGGTVTIAGRFYPNTTTQTIDFNMSDGVLTIVDVGFSSSTWASFDILASASTFTMSGGIIIIKNPNGTTGTQRDYRNIAGTVNITGGTVQFGTATTTGSPAFIVGSGVTTSVLPNLTLVKAATSTTITLNSSVEIMGNITINSGTTLDANGQDIDITGDWNNAGGTYTPGNNITTFDGITDQTISGGDTYYDVVINKTTGNIIIANDNTVSNTLTFHASNLGNIVTGANKLIVGDDASNAIARQGSGHIIGNLQRAIAADANTYIYPLGTATAYTPVEIDFTAGTLAGSLTGTTIDGDHPNVASSGIDGTSSVNRYWNFTINSGLGSANYDATFNWVSADEDAGFDYSIANAGKMDATTWTYPTMGTLTTNSARITGVSGFSDFQIGNYLTATISGYLTYYNNANTPLNGVDVDLERASSSIQSTTTDASGYYEFTGINPGDYDVVTDYSQQTGSINSTDAAQVNLWSVTNNSIEKVRFYAGDVTGSLSVLSDDANLIQQYFLTMGNPTPAFISDWIIWSAGDLISANPGAGGYPTVTVPLGAALLSQDFYGMVTGDFNRSFTPGAKGTASKTLTLSYGDIIEVGLSEFELPLYAGMDMDVGAISLILNFPSDILEVHGVYLGNDPNATLPYSVFENELRISWHSMSPLMLQTGEPLLTMMLAVNDPAGEDEIYFSLAADPLNELANDNFDVIEDAVLIVDVIKTMAVGIDEASLSNQIRFNNYPNPFSDATTIEYSIPVGGKVTIEIYDIMGNKIVVAVDEIQSSGDYQVKIDAARMQPGIYFARLALANDNISIIKTIKISALK
ncbi:MAG: T9SS type A sorting domain-containing protein, partial [Bacteroidales bacterium]|nr:T9SS type A sorting domain-containing protein [Bacteroidales bacterium]